MNINSLICTIMSVVVTFCLSCKVDASTSRNCYTTSSNDTNFNKLSTESIKKENIAIGMRTRSLGDLIPVPSLINILERYRYLEHIIESSLIIETNPCLLGLKQKIRLIIVDLGTNEQKYAFNQLKDLNTQITPEYRLEAYAGGHDVINVLISSLYLQDQSTLLDPKRSYIELKSLLEKLEVELTVIEEDVRKEEERLKEEKCEYVKQFSKNKNPKQVTKFSSQNFAFYNPRFSINDFNENFNKTQDPKTEVLKKADELLITEEYSIESLQRANEEAKKFVKISQPDSGNTELVTLFQEKTKKARDLLLSIRSKVQAAVDWLIKE